MVKNTRDKYWIKEGIAVAHRTNLNFMYTVKQVMKETREIRCQEHEKGSYEKDEKFYKKKVYMQGISVQCINRENKIDSTVFHSRELVPWEVAQEGVMSVNEWFNLQT